MSISHSLKRVCVFLCVCVCVRLCVGDLHKVIQILMASFSLSALSHAPSLASTLIACEFSLQFLRRSLSFSACLPACLSICPYFCLSLCLSGPVRISLTHHANTSVLTFGRRSRHANKERHVEFTFMIRLAKNIHTHSQTQHSHTHTRTQGYFCNKTRPGCLAATEHATLDRHEQNKHKLLVWVSSGFQQLMSN